jgi:hypothetical protein
MLYILIFTLLYSRGEDKRFWTEWSALQPPKKLSFSSSPSSFSSVAAAVLRLELFAIVRLTKPVPSTLL